MFFYLSGFSNCVTAPVYSLSMPLPGIFRHRVIPQTDSHILQINNPHPHKESNTISLQKNKTNQKPKAAHAFKKHKHL